MTKYGYSLLKSLPAFEAVARLHSVSKAAVELYVTAGSVSRHIKHVERFVGRRLFQRTHSTIVPNEDGALLHGAIDTATLCIRRALSQITGAQVSDRLVISADPDFAALWLVPRLADFCAIIPDTVVEILAQRGAPSMLDPRISCAIHYAAAGSEVDGGETLFRSRLFPVAAVDRVAPRRPVSLEDLRFHKLLHDRSFGEWAQYLQACGAVIDIDLHSGIVFSETSMCLEAAVRGQGVALGDEFLAATYLSEGRLERVFDRTILSKNAYYLTVFENAAEHPAVNVFRMWLLQTLQRQRTNLGIH